MATELACRKLNRFFAPTGNGRVSWRILLAVTFLLLVPAPNAAICKATDPTSGPSGGQSSVYPQTPAGVLEAFVKAGLQDLPLTSEEIDIHSIALREPQSRYLPTSEERDFCEATGRWKPFGTDYGSTSEVLHIATSFEIVGIEQGQTTATGKVRYNRIGSISASVPFYLADCQSRYTATGEKDNRPTSLLEAVVGLAARSRNDKEPCRILRITNDIHEVTYDLQKLGESWRIVCRYHTHVSVSSALKLLTRWTTAQRPKPRKGRFASEEQVQELKEDIKILQRYSGK